MRKFIITAFIAATGTFAANAQNPATPPAENPNQADIKFEKETHDFGTIPQGTPVTYTFKYKNTGKEPLIVTNASPSCGCTASDYSKDPIKPGGEGYVKATYNAASPGEFTKTITVLSNAKRSSVTLFLKGNVKVADAAPAGTSPAATPQH